MVVAEAAVVVESDVVVAGLALLLAQVVHLLECHSDRSIVVLVESVNCTLD